MHELKLFFAPGACSRVSLIALEKVKVPFETELIIFMNGAHKSPDFKKLNPSGKIPVLVADNNAISQNISILSWLNEIYPEAALFPKTNTSIERAQLLSLLVKFSADLHPLVSRIRMPHFFCDIKGGLHRVKEMASIAMVEQLQPIEDMLKSQNWIVGDDWSILDAYLHWVWFRITGAGFDAKMFPNISSHYEKTLQLPAIIKALGREAEAQSFLEDKGLAPNFLHSDLS